MRLLASEQVGKALLSTLMLSLLIMIQALGKVKQSIALGGRDQAFFLERLQIPFKLREAHHHPALLDHGFNRYVGC